MSGEGTPILRPIYFLDLSESDSEQPSSKIPTAGADCQDEKDCSGPFDAIPNEVLESIFSFCVQREPHKPTNTLDPNQPPWSLTKVNHRWRSIALSRKSLWCNIIIEHPSGVTGPIVSTKSALRLLLLQSKPLPLIICLIPGTSVKLLQVMKGLLPILGSVSSRWKEVHFEFPSMAFLKPLACVAGKLSLLKRILIVVDRTLFLGADQRFDMFKVAPALTHATMRGIKRIDQISLPFSQLVEYNGVREGWVGLLKSGRKLESLGMELGTSHSTLESPLIHHRLKTLHILATSILNSMELPRLTELTVYSHADRADSMDLSFMVDFIQRSCCKLERLTTQNAVFKDRETIASLMERLPHLRYLNVGERKPVIRWYFLCTLLTVESQAPLLPCLEQLTFTHEDPMDLSPPSPPALGDLLRSRLVGSRRFSAVVSRSLLPLGVKSLGLREDLIRRVTIVESPSLLSTTN